MHVPVLVFVVPDCVYRMIVDNNYEQELETVSDTFDSRTASEIM